MKLRILGNSLRLRVGQSELKRLVDGQTVQDLTEFSPQNRLVYAIHPTDAADMECTFLDGRITISIPRNQLQRWASGDDIGIEHTQGNLRLLIEKDLRCSSRPDPDAFPRNEAKK